MRASKKPRVAILTSLIDFSPAYSLTGIILDQARMLERHGYEYSLFVVKGFNGKHKERAKGTGWPKNISYSLAQTKLHSYKVGEPAREDFDEQVDTHFEGYVKAIEDFDVVITHDLMFIDSHLVQNAAIRKCVERFPDKRWLHWVHSAPSGKPANEPSYPSSLRFEGCENSTYVYLNHTQKQDVANHFGITTRDIAVVYNPVDLRGRFGFAPETCAIVEDYNLLDHDVLQVYPISTPRWVSKGVKQLCAIWGQWVKRGIKAKLVVVNAHCTQEKDENIVRKIETYAKKQGLSPGVDFFLTSRYAAEKALEGGDECDFDGWNYSVPHEVVQQLNLLANVFVFPSESECCSLIQAENAMLGRFTVLNRNFAPMLEFGDDRTLTYEFGNDPDRNKVYYECLARELWGELQQDPSFNLGTKARTKTYNRDWIWEKQLEPLLYKGAL